MKLRKRELFEFFTIDDKNVVTGFFKFVEIEPDSFVESAANTIATNGSFADFLRYDNGEARLFVVVIAKDKRYFWTSNGFAVMINIFHTTARVETIFLRQHNI